MLGKERKKITPQLLKKYKDQGEKVVLLTAYDYPIAKIEDEVGVDIILVGDSIGMVRLGYPTTLEVTMEELLISTKAVSRAVKWAMVVADMPYMSYQPSNSIAIKNAGRLVKEGKADAVKLEGSGIILKRIKAIIEIGIPVMGHIGFTPQALKKFGGYRVCGKEEKEVKKLVQEAKELEEVGVFCLIVECVKERVVEEIKKEVKIPIYGIGAGRKCDGEILVVDDMLGLGDGFLPKYVKQYVNLRKIIRKAIKTYIKEVKEGIYPGEEHIY
jgi:3-methyl-2-oxobutanoate hydroxymethyltransferase